MLRIYSSLFVISFIVLVLACEKPRQRSTDVPDPERLERYAIEREEAIKRWENRLAKLRSQKGNDDTWEPREAPSALPRGEVAKLPEGI